MGNRVLFILKRREDYALDVSYSKNGLSTGLLNSATFVNDMLNKDGIESKIVVVIDNNDIDREVTKYKPTHVIIEALWVVPEKFDILTKLHPNVKWIVRFHSEIPFLSNEGIAMEWLFQYITKKNVYIGVNSTRFLKESKNLLNKIVDQNYIDEHVIFLPNYYPTGEINFPLPDMFTRTFEIGCFGAIRPLKNHLMQAVAAIKFADMHRRKLNFHINVGRVEMKGKNILNNLHSLFANIQDSGHQLVVHDWLEHDDFLELISCMDICMQISFSETFNIVAADSISVGVPTVMSKEIPWARFGVADPTDLDDIVQTMNRTWKYRFANSIINQLSLNSYVKNSEKVWLRYFR
jgi:hypothetical protein